MRILAPILPLTFLLTIALATMSMVSVDSASAAPNLQVTPVETDLAAEEEPGPLAQALGVIFVLIIGGLAGFLVLRKSKAKELSATAGIQQASRLSDEERAEAVGRSEKFGERSESFQQVFVYDELDRNFHTYLAAYELIVRGLQVRLYSEPPNTDFNFGNKRMRRMDLDKAESFTTESLAPHLMEITSISQFSKHVGYRRRNRLALVVHNDDLQEAYDLFLDLGIRRVGTSSAIDSQLGL